MKTTPSPRTRTDASGRAFAGSQLQIQLYVNRRPTALAQAVQHAIGQGPVKQDIVWVSPLASDKFLEYRDRAFLRALGLEDLAPKLAQFWPTGGPRWDALGRMQPQPEVHQGAFILIEAKSHLTEMYWPGCQASSPRSLSLIEESLTQTKRWLNVANSHDWTGKLYQYANRLAHLYFLREVAHIDAWLVNICFLNDPHSPTRSDEWKRGISEVKREMGLVSPIPYTVDVFLPAGDRAELLTA